MAKHKLAPDSSGTAISNEGGLARWRFRRLKALTGARHFCLRVFPSWLWFLLCEPLPAVIGGNAVTPDAESGISLA